jgi:hypothetical protein
LLVEDALPGPAGEHAGGGEVFQAQATLEEAGSGDGPTPGMPLIPSDGSSARPARQHQALGGTP